MEKSIGNYIATVIVLSEAFALRTNCAIPPVNPKHDLWFWMIGYKCSSAVDCQWVMRKR